jgi:hypothetical protein
MLRCRQAHNMAADTTPDPTVSYHTSPTRTPPAPMLAKLFIKALILNLLLVTVLLGPAFLDSKQQVDDQALLLPGVKTPRIYNSYFVYEQAADAVLLTDMDRRTLSDWTKVLALEDVKVQALIHRNQPALTLLDRATYLPTLAVPPAYFAQSLEAQKARLAKWLDLLKLELLVFSHLATTDRAMFVDHAETLLLFANHLEQFPSLAMVETAISVKQQVLKVLLQAKSTSRLHPDEVTRLRHILRQATPSREHLVLALKGEYTSLKGFDTELSQKLQTSLRVVDGCYLILPNQNTRDKIPFFQDLINAVSEPTPPTILTTYPHHWWHFAAPNGVGHYLTATLLKEVPSTLNELLSQTRAFARDVGRF